MFNGKSGEELREIWFRAKLDKGIEFSGEEERWLTSEECLACEIEAVKAVARACCNGWVSVKERLPETTKCVLIYCEDNHCIYTAFFRDKEWQYFASATNRFFHDVTHWMELPSDPTEEKP